MALPSSGPISLKQVRDELKLSGSISLGQQEVRNLAGISIGAISMNDLKVKSDDFEEYKLTIGEYNFFGQYLYGYFALMENTSKGSIIPKQFMDNYVIYEFAANYYENEGYVFTFIATGINDANSQYHDKQKIDIIIENIGTVTVNLEKSQFEEGNYNLYGEKAVTIFNYFKNNIGKTIKVYIHK